MSESPDFPFPDRPGVALDQEYLCRYRDQPLQAVRLGNGHPAWLVTGHADVRTVLSDPRFSREAWAGGTLFARGSELLALVTSDPPTHTTRRRAAQWAFTHRQAELARPWIEQLAERLLDDIEAAGPPVDLIEAYTMPLPYQVICRLIGVPVADVEVFWPWVDVMMSAGRCEPAEEADASDKMYGYIAEQVRLKRALIDAGNPADDVLSSLLMSPDGLSEPEIIVLALGLVVAGGETTTNHLAMCVYRVLTDPPLAARLRQHPEAIPAAVEELLRWVWFAGTGGQPHVVLADIELSGVRLEAGQVVVPLTDAANRDAAVIDDPDEFRADRAPNPHLGFGYGRHLCLGAPHARVELQVGLAALLRRFDDLEITGDLEWRRQVFMRGVRKLPVTWRAP